NSLFSSLATARMCPRLFRGKQDDLVQRELEVDRVARLHRLAGAQPDARNVVDPHRGLLFAAEILDHLDTAAHVRRPSRNLPAATYIVGADRHHHLGSDGYILVRTRADVQAV